MIGENTGILPNRLLLMDNLIKDTATLELAAWLDPGAELPGWDILKGSPFGATLAAPEGGEPTPGSQLVTVQNYFAEYHLEYFRQRRYNHFPSRLHALILFATRTDAMTFRTKHPDRVFGKDLVGARTKGPYICSFHDASWLDYLRLPHSLSLTALDEVAEHYWSGRTVEEIGLTFMNEPWQEPPVIEALFQGSLEPLWGYPRTGFLPGFA
ncbi:MAG TPA: hypothetical protein PKL28_05070 [Rhodocyclaceae bacterium]|nr:hypothetical protein [Rhodocyclaceae bacterium]HNM21931.1 hypothetical protein [Rhodocyclaceae bacterium]HNM80401.1 hypothetical protein [Rhodocyclaceae bacterium]HNP03928.1 hypothetical protein [Rhodocyclaceae bacterium]